MKFQPSVIKEGRNTKQTARILNIDLRGRNSLNFEEKIRPKLKQIIENAVQDHRKWLEEEWNKIISGLEEAKKIPLSEVIEIFQITLEKRIKMISRLQKVPMEKIVHNDEQFVLILNQAVFDFIISCRRSIRRGDPLNQALSLAGLSHWVNPDEVNRLAEKYQDGVDFSTIVRAILNHPKNPDDFIDSYLVVFSQLIERYKDKIDLLIIKIAALIYPKNPDRFINWFIEMKTSLLNSNLGRKPALVREVLLSNHFKTKGELEKLV